MASEIFPLIKTGGLADVTGALPGAFGSLNIKVRSLVPGYSQILDAVSAWKTIVVLDDVLGHSIELLEGHHKGSGLDLLTIRAPELYERPGNPYLNASGHDWPDNHIRYAVLARTAALIAGGALPNWRPDVVHAHDWQSGLTALYMQQIGVADVARVFTIHNIAFQGNFPATLIPQLQLPFEGFAMEGFEYHSQISMLKAGIYYSDITTTVSPTYAREIQTAEFGMGMQGLLSSRRNDLAGIVNGIDTDVWDPANDDALVQTYDETMLDRRALNKEALQRRFSLDVDPNRLLFCIVSRLTTQKGMDLVLESLDDLALADGQLASIGTGDAALEHAFIDASKRLAGSVGCIIGYDEKISHQLQGGSDAILVPSRFEPCGLTQIYGLRYGCVPVVARVGGLADTIIDANDSALQDGVATGIQLNSVTTAGLVGGIERCIELYRQPKTWSDMQQRGMSRELSWTRAATKYRDIYLRALNKRSTI